MIPADARSCSAPGIPDVVFNPAQPFGDTGLQNKCFFVNRRCEGTRVTTHDRIIDRCGQLFRADLG